MFAIMSEAQRAACVIELHYLPSITYMRLFFQYDEVFVERHEHYQKRSYRNRAQILSAQGPQVLSVPLVKGKNQQQPITDVLISYDTPWHSQHWHAIQTAYGSAPFFIHYSEDIRDLLYRKMSTLFELNQSILTWLHAQVHAPTRINATSDYDKVLHGLVDMRECITPAKNIATPDYPQVFTDRLGFVSNLSVLDLLMHLGPECYQYLNRNWETNEVD
jgi:hypothetical protein